MKNWLKVLFVLAVVTIASVYIFIPSQLKVSSIAYCKCPFDAARRFVVIENNWQNWWPEKSSTIKNKYQLSSSSFNLQTPYINSALININNRNKSFKSKINLLSLGSDSVFINWNYSASAGYNPIKRIRNYFNAVDIKKSMNTVLSSFKTFIQKDDNIYGISIYLTTVKHTFLITNKSNFNHNPSTSEIYKQINFLKNYSKQSGLKQTYYAMMNVNRYSDTLYRLMVGLPINKEVKLYGDKLSFVKMVQGNFMTTQVNGGYGTINNALNQLQQYFEDYHKVSMAIPFEYIITDRLNETDTLKWVTKIYAPVQ